jgi:Fe-S-cluster containining protein
VLTDLVQIRRLGEHKREENERFRKHLKRHGFVETRFRRIAQGVEERIDCTACANCCRVATARITRRDVDKMARFLRIAPARFLAEYTDEMQDEGLILKRTATGCIFLSGNECTIYEARPHTCEAFPHLLKGDGSLVSRMWDFNDRACYCPIVYNALEAFKADTGFSR